MPLTINLPKSPGLFVPPGERAAVVAKALASIAIAEHKKVHPLTLLADDDAAAHVIKAMQGPANTIDPYGSLLTQELTTGLLESLKTECVALRLGLAPWARVSLDGFSELIFPSRTESERNFEGAFRGEGQPVKIGGMRLTADKKIRPHSLGVIATCSAEIMERSTEDFAAFVLQSMREDTAAALDAFVWSTKAATATAPAGLLHDIDPVPSYGVANDVKMLLKDYVAKNGNPATGIFIIHPSTWVKIKTASNDVGTLIYPEGLHNNCLRGTQVYASGHHVPKDKLILLDQDVLKMLFEFKGAKASADASIVEEDTDPAQQGDAAAAGQNVRSIYQTNAIALRALFETDYMLTRPLISYTDLPAGWGE